MLCSPKVVEVVYATRFEETLQFMHTTAVYVLGNLSFINACYCWYSFYFFSFFFFFLGPHVSWTYDHVLSALHEVWCLPATHTLGSWYFISPRTTESETNTQSFQIFLLPVQTECMIFRSKSTTHAMGKMVNVSCNVYHELGFGRQISRNMVWEIVRCFLFLTIVVNWAWLFVYFVNIM